MRWMQQSVAGAKKLGLSLIPDDPNVVINGINKIDALKQRFAPTVRADNFLGVADQGMQRVGNQVGVGLMAGGAAVNKQWGRQTKVGQKLKELGVNRLIEGKKARGAGAIALGALSVPTFIAAERLTDKPEYKFSFMLHPHNYRTF